MRRSGGVLFYISFKNSSGLLTEWERDLLPVMLELVPVGGSLRCCGDSHRVREMLVIVLNGAPSRHNSDCKPHTKGTTLKIQELDDKGKKKQQSFIQ